MILQKVTTLLVTALLTTQLIAEENVKINGMLPDEIEMNGGLSASFSHGGVSSITDLSSVVKNPALLARSKIYQFTGNYHTPAIGREFTSIGIIDSHTSSVALGLYYQGGQNFDPAEQQLDSPIYRRLAVGVAQGIGKSFFGMTVNHVSGYRITEEMHWDSTQGSSVSFGLLSPITDRLRFGLALQNQFANEDVKHLLPKSLQAGITFAPKGNDDLSLSLDYRQKDRISLDKLTKNVDTDEEALGSQERMVIASLYAMVTEKFFITGSYGQEMGGLSRRTAGLGLGFKANESTTLSVAAMKPDLSLKEMQKSVNVSITVRH